MDMSFAGAVGLDHYLILSALLFTIGVVGLFLNRRNVIVILMSIELMLLAVMLNFIAFSRFQKMPSQFSVDPSLMTGEVFTMFILTVAAAEAAIGLAILVTFFRNKGSIAVEDMNELKG